MANDTEAPTNAGTAAKLADKIDPTAQGLTVDSLDFVTAIDMWANTNGGVPTAKDLYDKYALPVETSEIYFRQPAVQKALAERGIDIITPFSDKPEWQKGVLTPEQLIVANIMVDLFDTRSDKKKLQDLGVSTSKYNTWMRSPDFQRYIAERAESLVAGSNHEAFLALVDKARQGDMSAIKLLLEYNKKYIDPSRIAGQVNTESLDFKRLLVDILEIITDEVNDPQVAVNISERIRGLVGRNNVANALVSSVNGSHQDEVVVPTIAGPRELTPELQVLMDGGVGVNN